MMKISKLLKVGAVALLAASLCFVSCKDEEDEENAISGDNISMTHDGTSGKYYRAFSTTSTKHYSSTAKITINNADTVKSIYSSSNTTGNYANCALGYVFGLTELEVKAGDKVKLSDGSEHTVSASLLTTESGGTTKPKFYTFGLVGIRYNKVTSEPQWYISWCENVPSKVFNYNDDAEFYTKLYDGTTELLVGYENKIIPTATDSALWSDFTTSLTDAKALSVTVKSTANDDGSYTINLYDAAGTTSIGSTQTVPASVTGLTAKTQLKLGRYTTVYNGETASGVIKLEDVSGAAVVFEEE